MQLSETQIILFFQKIPFHDWKVPPNGRPEQAIQHVQRERRPLETLGFSTEKECEAGGNRYQSVAAEETVGRDHQVRNISFGKEGRV